MFLTTIPGEPNGCTALLKMSPSRSWSTTLEFPTFQVNCRHVVEHLKASIILAWLLTETFPSFQIDIQIIAVIFEISNSGRTETGNPGNLRLNISTWKSILKKECDSKWSNTEQIQSKNNRDYHKFTNCHWYTAESCSLSGSYKIWVWVFSASSTLAVRQ